MHLKFKYADLLDDLAFKLVFGQESTKDVMIEFLNQVIKDRRIVDVEFLDKEMHPYDRERKSSVYDLFCKTDDGSRIVVELQRRKQDRYAERMLYYSMHQITRQVEAGAGSYDFCPVYVISILEFTLDQNDGCDDVRTVYRFCEEGSGRVLTDRLTFIFLELPKFNKTVEQLDGNVLEGMYFCLKNMQHLTERPEILAHNVFKKIFEVSELLRMDEETRINILSNMTTERDLRNQMEYAKRTAIAEGHAEGRAQGLAEGLAEGRAEGRSEGLEEVARRMLAMGMDVQQISAATSLTVERIEALR